MRTVSRVFCTAALRRALGTCLLLVAGFGTAPASRAQTGLWTAHTSMREVTALSASGDAIWAATTGGIFSFRPGTGEIERFTSAEGLHNFQVGEAQEGAVGGLAIAYDARCASGGCVWIGYPDGVLDRLEVETGRVRTFHDIARAQRYPRREINRLVLHGDSLFIATAFGLVVFDKVREEVRDTYDRLGTIAAATPVRDVTVAPVPGGGPGLWLATDQGVAHAALATVNLRDPAAWTVEREGLATPATRSVAFFDGHLYVGAEQDLAVRQPDGRYERLGLTGSPVTDLFATGRGLLGVEADDLIVVEPSGGARQVEAPGYDHPTSVIVGPDGQVWFGDAQEGLVAAAFPAAGASELTLLRDCRAQDVRCYPAGPYHNQFSHLTFDAAGNLWAGGVLAVGSLVATGFYRLDAEGGWTDFTSRRFDALQGRSSYTVVHADDAGSLWAGSQGNALVQVTPEDEVRLYTQENSTLRQPEGITDLRYILVGGIGSDAQGNLWVTNRAAARPLHVRTPDGAWTGLRLRECDGLTSFNGTYDELFVDSYGQKWIVVKDRGNLRRSIGLVVLDTKGTPTDPADDVCRFFNTPGGRGEGLPGLSVTAVVEDKDGFVWVATEEGLAYLDNNGIVASDRTALLFWPAYADRSQGDFLFRGLKVNDLAVDPANRLWVATDQGAWLMRRTGDGFEVVERFTANNSPLFSDAVGAVTVDPRTGRVFFATDRGLISYQGDAIAASEPRRNLLVYPNPVRIAEVGEPVVYIEGLVEETEILVLAAHGGVVSRFAARGGRARWDGRDLNGSLVPSGVYLVVAVGQNGEQTAFGKVAVIR